MNVEIRSRLAKTFRACIDLKLETTIEYVDSTLGLALSAITDVQLSIKDQRSNRFS